MSEHPDESGNILFDALKMNLFMNFRTGNYFVDTIITTILIGIATFFFQMISNPRRSLLTYLPVQETMDYWFSTNRIIIEGKSSIKSNHFTTRSEHLFSNRFRAIWYFINNKFMVIAIYNVLKNMLVVLTHAINMMNLTKMIATMKKMILKNTICS